MNGRTRVKGQLPRDKAVTNRGTGKGLRGEGQENTESYQSTWVVPLGYGLHVYSDNLDYKG